MCCILNDFSNVIDNTNIFIENILQNQELRECITIKKKRLKTNNVQSFYTNKGSLPLDIILMCCILNDFSNVIDNTNIFIENI